jgi:sigma-B regulation protein RsbU (phosphoserine phosphatase)
VLDPQAGEVCYAAAGHLPMLRRRGGTHDVEILSGDEGLPLGIEKRPLLADHTLQLAPGDTLLLVTDGVVEVLCHDRAVFKMDRLAEIFRRAGAGAGQLVEGIFDEMGRLCSVPPGDDLTVLAITWTPERAGVSSS